MQQVSCLVLEVLIMYREDNEDYLQGNVVRGNHILSVGAFAPWVHLIAGHVFRYKGPVFNKGWAPFNGWGGCSAYFL